MIQIPILLLSGLPPVFALATNKIISMFGTMVAIIRYHKHNKIIWRVALIAILPCLIASYLGGLAALSTPTWILEWMIIICIPIALFFTFQSKTETDLPEMKNNTVTTIAVTAPLGFYDGILGPGTGSYMTISLHRFLNIDYLHATAITKPLNLSTNIGAAIAFLIAGKVVWLVAVPMLIANAIGAWVGTHYAIKGGTKFIRKILIFVLFFMLIANIIKMMT
jgi:uncharacterized membrane protein YfcA